MRRFPKDNLTPRGVVLNLGHNLWACFDTDLLRIACIWEGEAGKPPVSADALAPDFVPCGGAEDEGRAGLSAEADWQGVAGERDLSGLAGGGEAELCGIPREATASPEEVGRGPVAGTQFKSVSIEKDGGVSLNYEINGVEIHETLAAVESSTGIEVARNITVAPHAEPLILTAGTASPSAKYPKEKPLSSSAAFAGSLNPTKPLNESPQAHGIKSQKNSMVRLVAKTIGAMFRILPPPFHQSGRLR